MDDKKLIDALEGCMDSMDCRKCLIFGPCNGTFASAIHVVTKHISEQDTELVTLRAQLAEQAALLVTVTAKYETAVRIQCQMTELQHKTETQLAAAVEDMTLSAYCRTCAKGCGLAESLSKRSNGGACRYYEWRGPQEAGEGAHD